nr:TonB-dependent receptor [Saprospiraceae bacterium]
SSSEFDHPFILDYKTELSADFAARTVFTYNGTIGQIPVRIIFGGEFRRGKNSAQNFSNLSGVRDTLRFADGITAVQGFAFQQFEAELREDLLFTASLSQNGLRYEVDRYSDPLGGSPFEVSRNFSTVWVPRVALSWRVSPEAAFYASLSGGFSPPTLDEFRTNEGSLNRDLQAEIGLNTELGFRSRWQSSGVDIDASLFYFRLRETISSFTNPDGVVLFRNAGATEQPGLELAVTYPLFGHGTDQRTVLWITHRYTGHFFTFKELERNGNDFSGNQLTGVAPHLMYNRVEWKFHSGLRFFFHHRYSDRLPLNDANTDYQEAYHTFAIKGNWSALKREKFQLNVHAGIDNLTDEDYSLGNDLNAFGGRYYQPAPGRNWYLGVSLKMTTGTKR